MTPQTTLEHRTGLSDALGVLLADYPRDLWEQTEGFDGLIRFWLDRHLMFRRFMDDMTTDTQKLLDHAVAPDVYATRLTRLGSSFVQQLHGHHQIEDTHYFPKLVTFDTRISAGFDILDADHHALDRHLADFVQQANAVLQSDGSTASLRTTAGTLHTGLSRLNALLDRHLTDEEDLIVPVLLKYGTAGLG